MNTLKSILPLFLLILVGSSIHCQKEDHNWLFGFALGDNVDPSVKLDTNWGATNIDFNFSPPRIFYDTCGTLDFLGANSSYSDADGALMFYSNGQVLVDSKYEIFGDSINFGTNWTANYPLIGVQRVHAGLPFAQTILSLPNPGTDSIFYVFYLTFDEFENYTYALRYSIVEKKSDPQKFEVLEKDVVLKADSLANNGLTACRHANGRDWWLIIPKENHSRVCVYLFSPDSIQLFSTYEIQNLYSNAIGWKYFSPFGNYYAMNDEYSFEKNNIVSLYSFNRESGVLENVFVDSFPTVFLGNGLSFSPDETKLYATSDSFVYQYDLESDDIIASRTIVAEYDGFLSFSPGGTLGQPTTFGDMAIGPDGKIYISAASGSNRYFHVINSPNELGLDCDLRQHSIKFPTSYANTIPNFPNFRLGPIDGSQSDTLGIDNHPIAHFRYTQLNEMEISFVNLSYYEAEFYEWDFGDGNSSFLEHPVHEYDENGVYEVCLTASNQNSSNTRCETIQIGPVNSSDENLPQSDIHIFPNPASDFIHVSLEHYIPRDAYAILYDMHGGFVLKEKLKHGYNNIEFQDLNSGMYLLEIKDAGQTVYTQQLIVVR